MRTSKVRSLLAAVWLSILLGIPTTGRAGVPDQAGVLRYLRCIDSLRAQGDAFASKCLSGEISAPEDDGFFRLQGILKSNGFSTYEAFQEVDQIITQAYFAAFPEEAPIQDEGKNDAIEGEFVPEAPSAAGEFPVEVDQDQVPETGSSASVGDAQPVDPSLLSIVKRNKAALQPAMAVKSGQGGGG